MAIPPPSIILILALGGLDTLLTLLAVLGLGSSSLGETDAAAGWIATLFGFFAVLGAVHVALKIVSLIGLYLARRWAIIAGALAFAVSWPLLFACAILFGPTGRPSLSGLAAWTIAIFLACTLPHWQRMIWRFP